MGTNAFPASRPLARFANRFAWATLIGLVYWTALTISFQAETPPLPQRLLLFLDVPVLAAQFVLPRGLGLSSGFSGFWLPGRTYCFPASPSVELFRYLRICIPTYLALFYMPAGFKWLARHIRPRRTPSATSAGV